MGKAYRNCTTCDAFLGGGQVSSANYNSQNSVFPEEKPQTFRFEKRKAAPCCRDNLELECREGGGYEAWRYKKNHVFADLAKEYVKLIGHEGGYSIRKEKGHFVLTLNGTHRIYQE